MVWFTFSAWPPTSRPARYRFMEINRLTWAMSMIPHWCLPCGMILHWCPPCESASVSQSQCLNPRLPERPAEPTAAPIDSSTEHPKSVCSLSCPAYTIIELTGVINKHAAPVGFIVGMDQTPVCSPWSFAPHRFLVSKAHLRSPTHEIPIYLP